MEEKDVDLGGMQYMILFRRILERSIGGMREMKDYTGT